MKVKNIIEKIDFEDFAGEKGDSIKAGISKDNLGFIFDIVSSQMYSNPIGSLIREITSNCFDSHIEAQVEKPVRLSIEFDEDNGHRIEFEDFGVGISTKRMKKIYANYFSSTKRDTNDQIGMFGLGSKSPLSYSDYFKLLTRFEGTEYLYIVHKGEETPMIDLIYEKPTDLGNGTCVSVPIKDGDYAKFIKEAKAQLSFFKNIMFYNFGIDNRYTIYETENFKYRPDFQFSDQMHLCVGDVTYPINFEDLGIPSIAVPIAIKFNIGDISVNPQREAIRWLDSTKVKVLEKIEAVITELIDAYNKQQNTFDDLLDWMNKVKTRTVFKIKIGEKESPLGVEDIELNITSLINRVKVKPIHEFYKKWSLKASEFTPLQKFSINVPDNPFCFHTLSEKFGLIKESKAEPVTGFRGLYSEKFVENHLLTNIIFNKTKENALKNKYIYDVYGEGYVLKRNLGGGYKHFKDVLNLPPLGVHGEYSNSHRFIQYLKYIEDYIFKKCGIDYDKLVVPKSWIIQKEKERIDAIRAKKEAEKNRVDIPTLEFYNFNYLGGEQKKFLNTYSGVGYYPTAVDADGHVENYHIGSGYIVSTSATTSANIILQESAGMVATNYYDYSPSPTISITKQKLECIPCRGYILKESKVLSYVIYGFKNDYELLKKIATMIKYTMPNLSSEHIKVIQISEKNKKAMKEIKNAIECHEFLRTDTKLLRRIVSAAKLKESNVLKLISKVYPLYLWNDLNRTVSVSINYLIDFDSKYDTSHENSLTKDMRLEILELAREIGIKDPLFDYHLKVVKEWFSGLEVLMYMTVNNESFPYFIDFFKTKKKRLNFYYYISEALKIALMLKSIPILTHKSRVRGIDRYIDADTYTREQGVRRNRNRDESEYDEEVNATPNNIDDILTIVKNDFKLTKVIHLTETINPYIQETQQKEESILELEEGQKELEILNF